MATDITAEDLLSRLTAPVAPPATTAADFTGGTLAGTVAEVQATQVQAAAPAPEFTREEKWDAFRRNTNTNFITNVLTEQWVKDEFADFDPTINHGEVARSLLEEYNIPLTAENLEAVSRAGTTADMAVLAKRLAQNSIDMDVLQHHGGIALASGLLDPATLLVDGVTLGTTRALTLGRIASGLAGAGAHTGVLAGADAGGKAVTGWDYVANAALSGAAFAAFGGEVGKQIITGQRNWYGGLSKDRPSAATRFLSQADAVAPTPEARQHLKALVDDPVRRDDYFQNDSAGALQRRFDNEAEGDLATFETELDRALQSQGYNRLSKTMDVSGRYSQDWDALNARVYDELMRRADDIQKQGFVSDMAVDPQVKKLADAHDTMMANSGKRSRVSGVAGFEDFTPSPGYVHRVPVASQIRAFSNDARFGKKHVIGVVRNAIRGGIGDITEEEAGVLARAWIDRALAKEKGQSTDLTGLLGKDTDSLINIIESSKLSAADKTSLITRIESKLDQKGVTKYARHRIPMDMKASYTAADGTVLKMTDLVDTNVSRIARNYVSAMNGRAALAKAGVGKDDAELNAFRSTYIESIQSLPEDQFAEAIKQYDSIMGNFTGNLPADSVPGTWARRGMSLSTSTLLTAQGVWQGAEYATIQARFGIAAAAKSFVSQFPGVRNLAKQLNGNENLVDEFNTAFNLDLSRDIRHRPWNNQFDTFLSTNNHWVDRVLHLGKQALPFVTGMKYLHSHQVRVTNNLTQLELGKAMRGNAKSLELLKTYGKDLDWEGIISRNQGKLTYIRDSEVVQSMGWSAWNKADADAMVNVMLRVIDDTILHGRAGQGSGFARTAVGQVLGQHRSFVSLAHNKLFRGTLHNQGASAYAMMLVHQYPLTFLMVMVNEARKGKLEDVGDEDYQKELAAKAVGYTAGLGFFGDVAGILGATGGRGGISTPSLAATAAPYQVAQGVRKYLDDDLKNDDTALYDIAAGMANLIPVIEAAPGTALAIEAMKGD